MVAECLDLNLSVQARYFSEHQHWVISFRWPNGDGWTGYDREIDLQHLERASRCKLLDEMASEISDRIKKLTTPEENQSWFIDIRRERIHVRVYQRTKRIWLRANTVTHNMEFGGRESLEIEVQTRSQYVEMRGSSIEIDGMLLQAELLEMLTIGDDCRIRFSVKPLQCQRIVRSPNEVDIRFYTSPRTARLASIERIRQMLETGQIEIPRSGYFDRLMDYPERPERARIEMPRLCQELPAEGHVIIGMDFARTEIHADDGHDLLEAAFGPNTIGDTTCKYNAQSRYLRCTTNPSGPCEECTHYEKI